MNGRYYCEHTWEEYRDVLGRRGGGGGGCGGTRKEIKLMWCLLPAHLAAAVPWFVGLPLRLLVGGSFPFRGGFYL